MSGYQRGHIQGHDPYNIYDPHQDGHVEDNVFVDHPHGISQDGTHGLSPTHGHINPHSQQQPGLHQHQQIPHGSHIQHPQQLPIYDMSQPPPHQEVPYLSGTNLVYGNPRSGHPKRDRPESMDDLRLQQMQHGQQRRMEQGMGGMGTPIPQYEPTPYHTHTQPTKRQRTDEPELVALAQPSVTEMEGMPKRREQPKGPKLKFTPEDDHLLVDLKENKSLTWKQIAEFFPGRSSGTLQVRYCTKLKAKTTQWTEETLQKLRVALHDYEQEKWRIIAQKVGTGFTSTACKEKAEEIL